MWNSSFCSDIVYFFLLLFFLCFFFFFTKSRNMFVRPALTKGMTFLIYLTSTPISLIWLQLALYLDLSLLSDAWFFRVFFFFFLSLSTAACIFKLVSLLLSLIWNVHLLVQLSMLIWQKVETKVSNYFQINFLNFKIECFCILLLYGNPHSFEGALF